MAVFSSSPETERERSYNEQYTLGWFIPFPAGWIFWQRWVERAPVWSVAYGAEGEDEPLEERVVEMRLTIAGASKRFAMRTAASCHLIFLEWVPSRMSLHYAQPLLPE